MFNLIKRRLLAKYIISYWWFVRVIYCPCLYLSQFVYCPCPYMSQFVSVSLSISVTVSLSVSILACRPICLRLTATCVYPCLYTSAAQCQVCVSSIRPIGPYSQLRRKVHAKSHSDQYVIYTSDSYILGLYRQHSRQK